MVKEGFLCKMQFLHLKCSSSDKQSVYLATKMISEQYEALFLDFFPEESSKVAATNFCYKMKIGFKLFTSTVIKTTESARAKFGNYPNEKKIILSDMLWCFENLMNT